MPTAQIKLNECITLTQWSPKYRKNCTCNNDQFDKEAHIS